MAKTGIFVVDVYGHDRDGLVFDRYELFHKMTDALEYARVNSDQLVNDYNAAHDINEDDPMELANFEERFLSPMSRKFVVYDGDTVVNEFVVRRVVVN